MREVAILVSLLAHVYTQPKERPDHCSYIILNLNFVIITVEQLNVMLCFICFGFSCFPKRNYFMKMNRYIDKRNKSTTLVSATRTTEFKQRVTQQEQVVSDACYIYTHNVFLRVAIRMNNITSFIVASLLN